MPENHHGSHGFQVIQAREELDASAGLCEERQTWVFCNSWERGLGPRWSHGCYWKGAIYGVSINGGSPKSSRASIFGVPRFMETINYHQLIGMERVFFGTQSTVRLVDPSRCAHFPMAQPDEIGGIISCRCRPSFGPFLTTRHQHHLAHRLRWIWWLALTCRPL